MIHEFRNPTPVITPKGKAHSIFVIDRGMENDLEWVCVQDDTGECWTWRNPDIRFQKNITMGRENISPFHEEKNIYDCEKCGKKKCVRYDRYSNNASTRRTCLEGCGVLLENHKKCPVCQSEIEAVTQWEDDKSYIHYDRCTQCGYSHF